MARTYIGGAGVNNKLAYDLIPPDIRFISKTQQNNFIGIRPFNGTMILELVQTDQGHLRQCHEDSNAGTNWDYQVKEDSQLIKKSQQETKVV